MLLFQFISVVILCLYIVLIFRYYKGWGELPQFIEKKSDKNVSLIIPFRNEEINISQLFYNLSVQSYLIENYEIIFVDDHSTDTGFQKVKDYSKTKNNISVYSLDDKSYGKKAALKLGIEKAKYDLIITTDADCMHSKMWVESLVNIWEVNNPKILVGPVYVQGDSSLFQKFQELEFSSLVASTAGSIGSGHPIMCNGANLMFEKHLYNEFINMLEPEIASGDDLFLMMAVNQKYPGSIHFAISDKAIVYTNAEKKFRQFVNQRMRWASKTKHYSDWFIIYNALVVFLLSAIISLFFAIGLFNIHNLLWAIFLIVIKSVPDFLLLQRMLKKFNKQKLLNWFVPVQFIYHFYISFVGLAGIFGKYTWKNRKI